MIQIHNLYKDYKVTAGKYRALSNVSMELPNAGLVALYGENGCGKTTLLNLISTLDTDYQGSIRYNGQDIRTFTEAYRRDIVSVVLQENYFIDYLNVSDNILLFSEDFRPETVNGYLGQFRIDDKEKESPFLLSGGQKQRVSLIRGLIQNSRILLVDEPTSSLNEEMEQEVFTRLREISREKLVILVSHNIGLIRQHSDIVIHMDKGEITSVEKNTSDRIEYGEDYVAIPPSLHTLASVDCASVKEKIREHGTIALRFVPEGNHDYIPDYSYEKETFTAQKRKMPRGFRHKLMRKSLRKSLGATTVGSLLLIILSVLLAFGSSFAFFDPFTFMFDSLQANYEGRVAFTYRKVVSDDPFFDTDKDFGSASYTYLSDKLHSDILLQYELQEQAELPVDSSGEYTNRISSIVYCQKENTQIKAGKYAVSGGIMLSDYIADGLIAASDCYSDYADILSDGIVLNNCPMPICGIVDSGYDKYLPLFSNDKFRETAEYDTFDLYRSRQYEALYSPLDADLSNTSLSVHPIFEGIFLPSFLNVNTLSDAPSLSAGECLVNRAFADALTEFGLDTENLPTFKAPFGEVTVAGVTEDADTAFRIYLNPGDIQSLTQSLFGGSTNVLIQLKSIRELKELESHRMNHNMPISDHLYDAVIIVNKLTGSFAVLATVIGLLLFLSCLIIFRILVQNDLCTLAFLKLRSYSSQDLLCTSVLKSGFMILLSGIMSILLYCFGTYGLNGMLSSLFTSRFVLFSVQPLSIALIVGCIPLCVIVASLFWFLIKTKPDPIVMIRSGSH